MFIFARKIPRRGSRSGRTIVTPRERLRVLASPPSQPTLVGGPIVKPNLLNASAIAAALSVAVLASASAGPAAVPGFDHEKCYGVAQAGKNDCQTATHSCAGTATKANDPASWIYVPAGTCAKIAGGHMEPM